MTRIFDPTGGPITDLDLSRRGDETPAGGYVYDAEGRIALAVEVALVTGRPLLVRGKPGTGKTSLAVDVATRLGRRFYRHTVTSRTGPGICCGPTTRCGGSTTPTRDRWRARWRT